MMALFKSNPSLFYNSLHFLLHNPNTRENSVQEMWQEGAEKAHWETPIIRRGGTQQFYFKGGVGRNSHLLCLRASIHWGYPTFWHRLQHFGLNITSPISSINRWDESQMQTICQSGKEQKIPALTIWLF